MFAVNGTCKLGHLITRDHLLVLDANIYISQRFENMKSDELAKHLLFSPKLIKQAMMGLFISLVKHISLVRELCSHPPSHCVSSHGCSASHLDTQFQRTSVGRCVIYFYI